MLENMKDIRHNFHHLIDQFENEKVLSQIYFLLKDYKEERPDIDFWDSLGDEQKHELELAWDESENDKNLVTHSAVIQEAKNWLTK
jgi:hypothetical protein